MKKSIKILLILTVIGAIGLAAALCVVMGTGTLMSREASKEYTVEESFNTVKLETVKAEVELVANNTETKVSAYSKAWLSHEIDMDDLVDVSVKGGVLVVSETPFEPHFFGIFPQPYELKLTVTVPQDVYEKIGGTK